MLMYAGGSVKEVNGRVKETMAKEVKATSKSLSNNATCSLAPGQSLWLLLK